jgi:multidrug efflux pump
VLVAGMTVGTLFTLFVVPVFYSLIAAEHRPSPADTAIEPSAAPRPERDRAWPAAAAFARHGDDR